MIKFFSAEIILCFFMFSSIQSSYASLIPFINSTKASSPNHSNAAATEMKTTSKVNSIIEKEKENKKLSEKKSGDKKEYQEFEADKELPQQTFDMAGKDILKNIKTTHGEIVIKKIKEKKRIITLTTEDKRTTGLQVPATQKPVTDITYTDNKNSKQIPGIQFPNNKKDPVATESYNANAPDKSRY